MSFLSCLGLRKRFGETQAVDDTGLEVDRGEMLALLGPSGCGKTTLLRMIAGFEAPDAGEIRLDGRALNDARVVTPPERRRIGMVFQDFALFPHMTVAGNVAFGLPRGANRERRTAELLDLVGLQGLQARFPHELSGGQQQRVAIARALAAEPALLLFDEPFSNLDPSIRQRVRAEVKQLIQHVGITAIFVTHDQEEALSLAGRVAVMIGGRVRQVGTPREIYTQPLERSVAAFIGEANFLPADVRGARAQSELGAIAVPAGADGPAEVMVRAEDIALVAPGEGVGAEVVGVEYFGHDMLATVRLDSGRVIRLRGGTATAVDAGQRVGVTVSGAALTFPAV